MCLWGLTALHRFPEHQQYQCKVVPWNKSID